MGLFAVVNYLSYTNVHKTVEGEENVPPSSRNDSTREDHGVWECDTGYHTVHQDTDFAEGPLTVRRSRREI